MARFHTLDITEPKEGLVVMMDRWWLCVEGDPKRAMFFDNSPQCNRIKKIAEHNHRVIRYPEGFTNIQTIFVEMAYVPQVR